MTIEQLLKDLGINKVGEYSNKNTYVIDLYSSEEFGKMYSLLDQNNDLEYEEESSLLTVDNGSLMYNYNDEFQFVLIADFNHDQYHLTIKEL